MLRRRRLVAALVGLAALVWAELAGAQVTTPEPAGPDFGAVLLADTKVTSAVKGALRSGRAFAEPGAFGDLTGDGTSDAVVLVTTPGAAGAIAAYVLSAQGVEDGTLRVVYRSQTLYRAVVRVGGGALVVLTPDYARGDDVCCPGAQLERTYVYDRRARTFRRTASRTVERTAR